MSDTNVDLVRLVKARHEAELMEKKNVVGVGVGYRERLGVQTDELAIVVLVTRKIPSRMLAPEDRIPEFIDGVPIDVQEVGAVKAQ